MAFQIKYYYTYPDIQGNNYRVDILQNTSTSLTPVEIQAQKEHTVTIYPELPKFEPIRGSGLQLNLISSTNMQFLDLFTADIKEYKVNHYCNSSIIGTYYLDTENYSEDFSRLTGYPVSFTANDGFNLLDRLNYVQSNGSQYTGVITQWQVITEILTKIGLDWNNIQVSLSTTIDGVTIGSGQTILHHTYVSNLNYYDEDQQAFSCRRVLESILMPYGAFIIQVNGIVYITDINTLAQDTSQTFKRYSASNFTYLGNTVKNLNLGDISTIKLAETGQNFTLVTGINRQVVSYSPYRQSDIYKGEVNTNNILNSGVTINHYYNSQYSWKEVTYNFSSDFEILDSNKAQIVLMQGTGSKNSNAKGNYLKLVKTGSTYGLAVKLKNISSYLLPSQHNYLKISCNGYARTKTSEGDTGEASKSIYAFQVPVIIKIGDYTFNNNVWVKNVSQPYDSNKVAWLHFQQDYKYSASANDQWIINHNYAPYGEVTFLTQPQNQLIMLTSILDLPPLPDLDGKPFGKLEIYLLTDYRAHGGAAIGDVTSFVKDIRLNDFEISISDKNGNQIQTNDIEYISYLDSKYKNEGQKIDLLHGTNINSNASEYAGLIKSDMTFIQQWTREGKTDIIENLLLRSVISNAAKPMVKLTSNLKYMGSILGYVTYNNYLTGKKLMIAGANINHQKQRLNSTLLEISKDYLDINKSF